MQIDFTEEEIKELEIIISMKIVDTNRLARVIIPSVFNEEIHRLTDLREKVGKLRAEKC